VAFWPNQARPVTHRRPAVDGTSRGGWRRRFAHVLVDEITRGGKATTAIKQSLLKRQKGVAGGRLALPHVAEGWVGDWPDRQVALGDRDLNAVATSGRRRRCMAQQ
jgi:hypothetical protein